MDKGVLDENDPHFIGMYDGRIMNEKVRSFIEDETVLVIMIGALMTDFSSAAFTCNVDPEKMLNINQFEVKFQKETFQDVNMKDLMKLLLQKVIQEVQSPDFSKFEIPAETEAHGLNKCCKVHDKDDAQPLVRCCIYAAFEKFFRPGDIIVTDTSSSIVGVAATKLPSDAIFINQTLWGAIGFSVPCTFGVQLAAPDRRVVLITGDGSLQVTAQEISQMGAQKQSPVIFVLNNQGYLIERMLCDDSNASYNDVPNWKYTLLPNAFSCPNWYGLRADTAKELCDCMTIAEQHVEDEGGGLVEVICGKLDAPDAAWNLYSQVKQKKHEMLDKSV